MPFAYLLKQGGILFLKICPNESFSGHLFKVFELRYLKNGEILSEKHEMNYCKSE